MTSPLEPSTGQMRWVGHATVDFAVGFNRAEALHRKQEKEKNPPVARRWRQPAPG
jgi:hypothetical protein